MCRPRLAYRAGGEVAVAPESLGAEQVLSPVAEGSPKPCADRYPETHLGPFHKARSGSPVSRSHGPVACRPRRVAASQAAGSTRTRPADDPGTAYAPRARRTCSPDPPSRGCLQASKWSHLGTSAPRQGRGSANRGGHWPRTVRLWRREPLRMDSNALPGSSTSPEDWRLATPSPVFSPCRRRSSDVDARASDRSSLLPRRPRMKDGCARPPHRQPGAGSTEPDPSPSTPKAPMSDGCSRRTPHPHRHPRAPRLRVQRARRLTRMLGI